MAGTDFEAMSEAGEYVLGTLDKTERIAFEARLTRDTGLRAEVDAWRQRLAPLDAETADAEPSADVFEKILLRIDSSAPANIVQLQRRIKFWRNAAAVFGAVAAALLIFAMIKPLQPVSRKGIYVAVLQGKDRSTGFVAAVDIASKTIAVRSIAATSQPGHSYELWALGGGRKAPQPIGLIAAATRLPADTIGDRQLADTLFAVSLEPAGGSPTGSPTGPVLFTGKLLATD
jgi:anti-sigma-K factor RskA